MPPPATGQQAAELGSETRWAPEATLAATCSATERLAQWRRERSVPVLPGRVATSHVWLRSPGNVVDETEGPLPPFQAAAQLTPLLVLGSEVLHNERSNEEPGILGLQRLVAQRPDCQAASLRREGKEGGEGRRHRGGSQHPPQPQVWSPLLTKARPSGSALWPQSLSLSPSWSSSRGSRFPPTRRENPRSWSDPEPWGPTAL